MLKNYLKISIRNLIKNKGFTFINILGLSMGVCTFLLISLYVLDELSFDNFHKNGDRIYRINADINFGGKYKETAEASDPLGFTLKKDYPIIENAVRFRRNGSRLVKKEGSNQNMDENAVIFADSTLFDVFTLPFIAGSPKTALCAPNSLVITEKIALKYFNKTNVVGEVLILDNKDTYKITGVIKDIPHNSHFKFDFFLSMEGLEESKKGNFLSHNFNTYLLLKEGVNPNEVEEKFPQILTTYLGPQAEQTLGIKYEALITQGAFIRYSLIPLKKIHLHSDRQGELE
ncbi:MAG TPA: ABC transporter permease, partial [Cytophagales bacterium]|nr:ABC transporter permease [Cytophagales bacterium]